MSKYKRSKRNDNLLKSSDCCTYCNTAFGTMVVYKGKARILCKQRDHIIPLSKGGKNNLDNSVVSCQICNSIKAASVYESAGEAQNAILDQLLESDWRIVPGRS